MEAHLSATPLCGRPVVRSVQARSCRRISGFAKHTPGTGNGQPTRLVPWCGRHSAELCQVRDKTPPTSVTRRHR